MRQPCIKFISHTVTYIGFIGMIIVSSLKFAEEQQSRERFSFSFPQYAQIFSNYASNTTFKYRFPNSDFYIRMQQPSNLDYAISLWVLGKKKIQLKILSIKNQSKRLYLYKAIYGMI
jgi:hypothetical protein